MTCKDYVDKNKKFCAIDKRVDGLKSYVDSRFTYLTAFCN